MLILLIAQSSVAGFRRELLLCASKTAGRHMQIVSDLPRSSNGRQYSCLELDYLTDVGDTVSIRELGPILTYLDSRASREKQFSVVSCTI